MHYVSMNQNLLGAWLKCRLQCSTTRVSDLVYWGWGPIVGIFNVLPGYLTAVGLGVTLEGLLV